MTLVTTNTVKVGLFLLLALSIVVPATVAIATETPSAEKIDHALKEVQSYVEINDLKIDTMDIEAAKINGVSAETLNIATQLLTAQNNMIQRVHDNPNQRMYIAEEDSEGVERFGGSVREGKQGGSEVAESLGIQFASAKDVCGGSSSNPHLQPSPTASGPWSTETAARNTIPSSYHLVPFYTSYNYGDDYHDPKTLYNCTTDSFHYQSIVVEEDDKWYHSEHHHPGEPNPEVLAYTWPVWWWGFYVAEWH